MCRKKRVDPGKFPYQKKKKSLYHCQGFIQDFELGEGGNFHVFAKGGGGGGGVETLKKIDTLRLI